MPLKKILDKHKISAKQLSEKSNVPKPDIIYILYGKNPQLKIANTLLNTINNITNEKYALEDLL
jgi:predicted transcriptional regulator